MQQFLAAAPTLPQARGLYWNDLKDLIPKAWITSINESRLEIDVNFYGLRSQIKVIGLEKAQRAEGMGLDGVLIDESSDVRPGVFSRSFMPALADRQGWCVRMGVPKRFGVGAVEYRDFCELGFSKTDPSTTAFTWPSWDILDPEEMELQKRLLTQDDFDEQFGAQWITVGQGAFHAFDPQTHVQTCTYDPMRPLWLATDFNANPMAWVLSQSDGRTLYTFDEVFLRNTYVQATLDVLFARYGSHKGGWRLYGDATGNARTANAPLSAYAIMLNDKRFKFDIKVPASNPNPVDRLASCNALLRNAAGEVHWYIDHKCQYLISDLRKRTIASKGGPAEGVSGEDIGHASDAVGYLIHSEWPSTRLITRPAMVAFLP